MGSFRNCPETDLVRAEGGLLAFTESFSDAVMIISSQGSVCYCNKALLRELGYGDSELLGKPFERLFISLDMDTCTAMENQNPTAGWGHYTLIMYGIIAHKNGSAFAAELTMFPFSIRGASMAAVVCRLAPRPGAGESARRTVTHRRRPGAAHPAVSTAHTIIGTSRSMSCIQDMIGLVGQTDSSVLITGESGTGKELVAEAIHAASRRARRPLVKLNCAALPETLFESELFGHSRGSFTGAVKDSSGLLKAADGGTLFLDEIGDITSAGQTKLLQVLENRQFYRIGESLPITIDVRIIAATNQDLQGRIQQRLFREDLYYRLNVIEIKMPPLRERTEDIPDLVEHFLTLLNRKLDKSIHAVSEEVLHFFSSHRWPGNVRELEHVLEHACVLCQKSVIGLHDLPAELRKAGSSDVHTPGRNGKNTADRLVDVLLKTGGNKARAARMLGINRKTLYRNLKKYHLSTSI